MIAYLLLRRRDATYNYPSDCAKTSLQFQTATDNSYLIGKKIPITDAINYIFSSFAINDVILRR